MTLQSIIDSLNGYLWSTSMIALCLGVAVIYSFIMVFPQVRHFKAMVGSIRGGSSDAGISPFQAFAMALGGRIGIGTIAGVGTAIYAGGPGSIFWMWIYAIFGSAVAMGESMLAQIWKEDIGGEYRGGPAYYLKKTPIPFLGGLTMIIGILAYGFTGPTVQAFNIADSMKNAFNIDVYITGGIIAVFFGVVVLGGMRRIGTFAGYAVPIMAGLYMVLTLVVLGMNIADIPAMFGLIFKSAFGLDAVYGGILGSAISMGIRRCIYSSEAGMGSGAHAAASSEVSHPVKQGLAQAFSVYNTIIICTCTALMILCTGAYNVADGAGGTLHNALPDIQPGIGYTQAALDTLVANTSIGSIFIAIAILFFAFTTLLSFGFYAIVNISYLMKKSPYLKVVTTIVVISQMCAIFLGSIKSSDLAWGIADVGVGLLTWTNLLGMIFLAGVCARCMKDYDEQKKQGLDPVFRPEKAGIKGAELWNRIVAEKYSNQNKDAGNN